MGIKNNQKKVGKEKLVALFFNYKLIAQGESVLVFGFFVYMIVMGMMGC
jgi:hypothetical protein